MKLDLCNYKENKHNSRINNYGNDKILINSQEVWFEITRKYAKVGCKNLIIFSYRKSFMQILQKWKKNYK
jgi:peroxiredoxin